MSGTDPKSYPVELNLERTKHLRIKWADGQESVIVLADLRRSCPCATCRAAREERGKNPLVVVQAAGDVQDQVTADQAELVGSYALRITWKDGHDTGIYDFALLRGLGTSEIPG